MFLNKKIKIKYKIKMK